MQELREHIASIVTKARIAKGMTVKELSKASGVSERTIYYTESAEKIMRADSLSMVARALDIVIMLGGK